MLTPSSHKEVISRATSRSDQPIVSLDREDIREDIKAIAVLRINGVPRTLKDMLPNFGDYDIEPMW